MLSLENFLSYKMKLYCNVIPSEVIPAEKRRDFTIMDFKLKLYSEIMNIQKSNYSTKKLEYSKSLGTISGIMLPFFYGLEEITNLLEKDFEFVRMTGTYDEWIKTHSGMWHANSKNIGFFVEKNGDISDLSAVILIVFGIEI